MAHIPPTKNGHDFGEATSALQKSVRRGLEEEALYWAVELDESGYPDHVWRRLLIMASEDVGLADPMVCVQVGALHDTWTKLRKRKSEDRQESWRLMLVQAVLVLARARKSRIVDHALLAYYLGPDTAARQVPDVALDKHTLKGKRQGRGWDHFWDQGTLLNDGEGALEQAPHLEDPFRERAMAATSSPRRRGERGRSRSQLNWHNDVSE